MIPIATLGSSCYGYCNIHKKIFTGTIVTSSNKTFAGGLGVARMGDVVLSPCGHTGVIVTASLKTYSESVGIARLGDEFGPGDTSNPFRGTIITGSSDTFSL